MARQLGPAPRVIIPNEEDSNVRPQNWQRGPIPRVIVSPDEIENPRNTIINVYQEPGSFSEYLAQVPIWVWLVTAGGIFLIASSMDSGKGKNKNQGLF